MNISAYAIPGITERSSKLTAEIIISTVARYCKLDPVDLKKHSRKYDLVKARRIAMYFMKWHVPMSYANVGAHFGQNHATVIHAVREFENKMKLYPSDRQQFQEVCSLLGLRGSTELLISMQNEYKIKAWDDKNSFVVYRGTIIMRGSMQACREFVMRKLNIR